MRDLVLVGGGHANVQVLKRFGMRPELGVRLTLISSAYESPYSGMLPGCIAGRYTEDDIHINLGNLARFAGARFIAATAESLDLEGRRVRLVGRPDIPYDVLSLNIGAMPTVAGADAVAVKPIGDFLPKWWQLRKEFLERSSDNLCIVGAGAGGVELALAVRASLPEIGVTVVGPELLPGHSAKARARIMQVLRRRNVNFVVGTVESTRADSLRTTAGEVLNASKVLWVTGVEAPSWLQDSDIATDESGFIRVNEHLASVSHPEVFAAGDVAHLEGQERPKSGVFAVRAGPFLSHNLRAKLIGGRLRRFKAQANHLALIGDGHGRALASRGDRHWEGRAWWYLKDWIDRRFVRKFTKLSMPGGAPFKYNKALRDDQPAQAMRCGGCGAKIAAEPLRRVLARLPKRQNPAVLLGIGDDAAQITIGSGSALMTIDGFRAMLDDPYLFGRIATHHSLNDILAMGARPVGAMALVTIPLMADGMMEEELYQIMRGIVDVLDEHDAVLIGGHSAEGLELSLGLSVHADAPRTVLAKGGATAGEDLILTKPLGSGLTLAAAMAGDAPAKLMTQVLAALDQSNARAAQTFVAHNASALTDVTGFGLLGHLSEMLRAAGMQATLALDAVPVFEGVTDLYASHESSLQNANEQALTDYELKGAATFGDPRVRMLVDPQTSGGLLGSVSPSQSSACVAALQAQGYTAAIIGRVGGSVSVIQS